MGNLSAFLHPEQVSEREVIISNRFKENGKVVAFKIKPITQEENNALVKKCTITYKDRSGKEVSKLDSGRYSNALIVAGTVYPDFSDKELCDAYGVIDPLLVAPKMLLAGEFQKLADAIADISGINDSVEEEAKN